MVSFDLIKIYVSIKICLHPDFLNPEMNTFWHIAGSHKLSASLCVITLASVGPLKISKLQNHAAWAL